MTLVILALFSILSVAPEAQANRSVSGSQAPLTPQTRPQLNQQQQHQQQQPQQASQQSGQSSQTSQSASQAQSQALTKSQAIQKKSTQAREDAFPLQSLADGVRPFSRTFARAASQFPATPVTSDPRAEALEQARTKAREISETLGVCACGISANSREATKRSLGKTSVKDVRGKRFALSVVSFDYALKIFQYLTLQKHIPFGNPQDGCFARAHEMSYLLEKHGILTGKVMAIGEFRVRTDKVAKGRVAWRFHVASVIAVDDGTTRGIWVLDPSLFNEPVPLESWVTLLMDHSRAKLKDLYLTNRFIYHPAHRMRSLRNWNDNDLKAAHEIMNKFISKPDDAPKSTP